MKSKTYAVIIVSFLLPLLAQAGPYQKELESFKDFDLEEETLHCSVFGLKDIDSDEQPAPEEKVRTICIDAMKKLHGAVVIENNGVEKIETFEHGKQHGPQLVLDPKGAVHAKLQIYNQGALKSTATGLKSMCKAIGAPIGRNALAAEPDLLEKDQSYYAESKHDENGQCTIIGLPDSFDGNYDKGEEHSPIRTICFGKEKWVEGLALWRTKDIHPLRVGTFNHGLPDGPWIIFDPKSGAVAEMAVYEKGKLLCSTAKSSLPKELLQQSNSD
jgi:hypothetical protein